MLEVENKLLKRLEIKSILARKNILEMTTICEGGHLAGSLSCIDIIITLYFSIMKYDPDNPDFPNRDRFVLSKGHAAPALYATLALAGYFPQEELLTLRKLNSRLQGHPDCKKLPGIEISTGSLGQGLSVAVGMALGYKYDSKNANIYCLLGDGECDEGQVWEAALFANSYNINNITAIIDRNWYQLDGKTESIMKLEPLDLKWRSFGWEVLKVDGHNYLELNESLKISRGKRTVIIADTVKGKGISFLENNNKYHSKPCSKQECTLAIKELDMKLDNL